MKQFLLPVHSDQEVRLTGEDFHYLHHVRRLTVDDSFPGIDAEGNRYHVIVRAVHREAMDVHILPAGSPDMDLPNIHLLQCIPKGGKFDQVVRMATEAGVKSITPVLSEHTVVRLDSKDKQKKHERWQRVMQEAVQQSGSRWVPEIYAPQTLSEVINNAHIDGRILFFHQTPLAPASLHEYCSGASSAFGVCVGPEGGFSNAEVQMMLNAEWWPGYLGPWVLRTEHAGLYAIAALQTILLEKAKWKIM